MRLLVPRSIYNIFIATRQSKASCAYHGLHTNRVTRCVFAPLDNAEDIGGDRYEFQKWGNGDGIFHKSACIDPTALVEVGAVVHPRAILGAHVHVGSGAIVGPGVVVGQSTKIGYNVALSNCTLGDSCVIHHGVCIGQDGIFENFEVFIGDLRLRDSYLGLVRHDNYGFGFESQTSWEWMIDYERFHKPKAVYVITLQGYGFFVDEHGNMKKKPQEKNVRIGNFVEIGANTCVDRGSWRDTEIGDHTKIDNLVQIGHNVVIGKCCIICGQAGIAGSATIKDYVTFGGRVAVRDHVTIASKVRLAANSCVTKDITEPGDYGGFPAVPAREWRRQVALQRGRLKEAPRANVSFEGHEDR